MEDENNEPLEHAINNNIHTSAILRQTEADDKTPLSILDEDSSTDPTLFLTNYSTMSNIKFKQMLMIATSADSNVDSFKEILDTDEQLTLLRQLTHLLNKMNYVQLQKEQWSYYYQVGMNENIWHGRVSKKTAMVNSMPYTYGRSKTLIKQRQKKYEQEHDAINHELNDFIKQNANLINLEKIMSIITYLVDKSQYQFRMELERRRVMLKSDATDHQLVQTFYNLKPRDSEIRSARNIWRAVDNEQSLIYEMNIFRTWLSTRSHTNNYAFNDLSLTKIAYIFTELAFADRTHSSHHSKIQSETLIFNWTDDLSRLTLQKAHETLRDYSAAIQAERTKLLTRRQNDAKPPTVEKVMEAIENRRLNMIARARHNLHYKHRILFGSSPP